MDLLIFCIHCVSICSEYRVTVLQNPLWQGRHFDRAFNNLHTVVPQSEDNQIAQNDDKQVFKTFCTSLQRLIY